MKRILLLIAILLVAVACSSESSSAPSTPAPSSSSSTASRVTSFGSPRPESSESIQANESDQSFEDAFNADLQTYLASRTDLTDEERKALEDEILIELAEMIRAYKAWDSLSYEEKQAIHESAMDEVRQQMEKEAENAQYKEIHLFDPKDYLDEYESPFEDMDPDYDFTDDYDMNDYLPQNP